MPSVETLTPLQTKSHTKTIGRQTERSPTPAVEIKEIPDEYTSFIEFLSEMLPRQDKQNFLQGAELGMMTMKSLSGSEEFPISRTTTFSLLKKGFNDYKNRLSDQRWKKISPDIMNLFSKMGTANGEKFIDSIAHIDDIKDISTAEYIKGFEGAAFKRGMSVAVVVYETEESSIAEKKPIKLYPNIPIAMTG